MSWTLYAVPRLLKDKTSQTTSRSKKPRNVSAKALKRGYFRKGQSITGSIPASFYGGGKAAQSLSIVLKDFRKLAESDISYRPGKISIEGAEIPCVIKGIQHDPVNGMPRHVELLNLNDAKTFTMFLPIETEGTSPGVKRGGILNITVPKLEIKVDSSAQIPESVKIDISSMHIGMVFHLEDLQLPSGIIPANALRDRTILSIIAPSAAAEPKES